MVRLEVAETTITMPVKVVSIPAWYDWKLLPFFSFFFSIDVSIPAWYDWKIILVQLKFPIVVFQFQHGTIGRNTSKVISPIGMAFQFQHGTIGRVLSVWMNVLSSSFNSSMVRLEAVNGSYVMKIQRSFNSSMVRLEAY